MTADIIGLEHSLNKIILNNVEDSSNMLNEANNNEVINGFYDINANLISTEVLYVNGLQITNGFQGSQGFQGIQGFQGSIGAQGAIGSTGLQGNKE